MNVKRIVSFSAFCLVLLLGIYCKGESSNQENVEQPTANLDPMQNKGIGPIKSIELGALDAAKAKKGQNAFESKCAACHKFEEKVVGPALQDVTKRRSPEWILNMILNPVEMTQKDSIAKELLETHLTQMTFQNVSEEEAKEILEYFRQKDSK